ncbi:MAG: tRNA (guanosine(37)-N1)-methyltransferase TrmD [Omnitrophica WOR_2 bacterium GWF2_43_52]|nr:MAG: tRNA (guanosine(37)-N1)-methyltransferase TrmD [Omnitrophica WOR_2 bacterium GWA2_44_7]OGX21965.1 MAG: tRNA (guanosine(37)-N1)-methyltransferase TrmD [Omnitrophica WOR_2 bacterium GWF2_43_52]HAH20025.1 tRNA (guanosine(37)-N1)-methyltransferase TrmD [Candidatus Omnitrophota bacterium]HBG63066.1 tRNA (guanosine(37)-N1)-methyltransferase TrmD [Candidatus Omnitrophota bacterium]
MLIDIITIFPEVFKPYIDASILGIAQKKEKLHIRVHDLRDYTLDKHKKVDDRPFGGGPGMVMMAEPVFRAVEQIRGAKDEGRKATKTILLCPQGKTLNQKLASKLSKYRHLILICGRYEGVDERVRTRLADEEISIGDYILTGGELAAMVLVDAVARLIPGVLGHKDSSILESFSNNLLEYPQYTRPADFRGMEAPEILLSGDHKKIEAWRRNQALAVTRKKRPDLLIIGKQRKNGVRKNE